MKLHTQCILKVASLVLVVALCAVPMINTVNVWAVETELEVENLSDDTQTQSMAFTRAEYELLYNNAKAAIADYNKLEALKLALNAVDARIPNWQIWKYVIVAEQQVTYGSSCGGIVEEKTDEICLGGPWTTKMYLMAEMVGRSEGGIGLDEFFELPEVQELSKLTFLELINIAKTYPKYKTDDDFKNFVDACERMYNRGLQTLRESVEVLLPKTQNVDKLSAEQLISMLKTLPEYDLYFQDIRFENDTGIASLYMFWLGAKMQVESCDEDQETCGGTGWSDEDLWGSYAGLVAVAQMIKSDFRVNLKHDSIIAQVKNINPLQALTAAIKSVDAQIPHFNIWKEVPNAVDEATGSRCYAQAQNEAWITGCGGRGTKGSLAVSLLSGQYDTYEEIIDSAELQQLDKKSFKELIDLGKADSRYKTDANFRNVIDNDESIYQHGLNYLRTALRQLAPDVAGLDNMDVDQLIAELQKLPEYTKYGIAHDMYSSYDGDGLFDAYFNAMFTKNHASENGEDFILDAYARLVVAARNVDPNFQVDFSGVLPSLPQAGTITNEERSAMVIKIALGSVTGIIIACGLALITKRFLFSPLKRRK